MVYWTDPLTDNRWPELVESHPASSVFHTRAWLGALCRSYGYEPVVLTTSAPGEALANGILFCRVRSLLTGRRLVSLPYSDHCALLASAEELPVLLGAALESARRERLKYLELRPTEPLVSDDLACSQSFIFHMLDLRREIEDIFAEFHADCVRRKIRRAGREELTVEAGRSDALLDDFFELQVITRRRHGFPPQPRQWFRNLLDEMGDRSCIRVARHSGRAIASILTLRYRRTEVYKYGCSRAEHNHRGGMQLLLWNAIEEAKASGMEEMDFGRSDILAEGLIRFKDRWGTWGTERAYYRFPEDSRPWENLALLSRLPKPLLVAAGRLLYRHMG